MTKECLFFFVAALVHTLSVSADNSLDRLSPIADNVKSQTPSVSKLSNSRSGQSREKNRGFLLLGLAPGQSVEMVYKILERNYGIKMEYSQGGLTTIMQGRFSKVHSEFDAHVELYFANNQLASGKVNFLSDGSAVEVVLNRNFGTNLPELLKTQQGSYLENIYCVSNAASFIVGTTARGTTIIAMKTPSDPAGFMRPRGSSYMPERNGCDSAPSDGLDRTVVLYPAGAQQSQSAKLIEREEFERTYGKPLSANEQRCLSLKIEEVSSGNSCTLVDVTNNECVQYSEETYWTNLHIRNSCSAAIDVSAVCPALKFNAQVRVLPGSDNRATITKSVLETMFGKGHYPKKLLESCELRQALRGR